MPLSLEMLEQIFGVPTYNSLFQWVLDYDEIRASFFSACIPEIQIQSSKRLDSNMKPLKKIQNLRQFMTQTKQKEVALCLASKEKDIALFLDKKRYKDGEKFLKEIALHFGDMQKAFPEAAYDGSMDFLCDLNTGEKAFVEMQILPEDHWDRRALAYASAIYSNQISRGGKWSDIRTVIGINILGGGLNDEKHWPETPDQYMRKEKFQEQINGEFPPRFMEEIGVNSILFRQSSR
jgi:hypothetical protein